MSLGFAGLMDMNGTTPYTVRCPYCGESFQTSVDTSIGSQDYIEDCYVCCRPILFSVTTDGDGNLLDLETRREDD